MRGGSHETQTVPGGNAHTCAQGDSGAHSSTICNSPSWTLPAAHQQEPRQHTVTHPHHRTVTTQQQDGGALRTQQWDTRHKHKVE